MATLALLGVAFVATVLGQAWRAIRDNIEKTAGDQARLAVEFNAALRQYVADTIRPEFQKRASPGEFMPEVTSSSFVTRGVFDRVRERFPDFLARFPSVNPRNPSNQATEDEQRILRYFAEHPEATQWTGTIKHQGKSYFATAIPRRFTEPCLRCHGDADAAPTGLVRRYGTSAGFGRSVGDLSIDLAGVSISDTLAAARRDLRSYLPLAAGFGIVFLAGAAGAICLDVWRRRRTTELLHEQKEEVSRERARLQAILDSLPVGMLIVDEQLRVVRVNDVVARWLGKPPSALLNRQPGDGFCCFHASESPQGCGHAEACRQCTRRKAVETALPEGRAVHHLETTIDLLVEGQRKQLSVMFSATPLELGGKRHVLLSLVDIRQRKAAEQRYRALFESSPDAIMTMAPPLWRFTSGNPATIALFQLRDEAEFLAASIAELSPPTQPDGRPSAEKAVEMIETAMREGSRVFEWVHQRRGGERFPAVVMLNRVDLGEETFLQATVRDVTAQKESERKQREYAAALERGKAEMERLYRAAEAATRAKSEFLANMSHEIRTPMTAILGYADLLDANLDCCQACPDHAACPARAQHHEHLATIRRNGQHLLQIINDILDLSKIEAGRLDVEWQPCSPTAILAEVMLLMRVRAEAKGLSLQLRFDGPMPQTILTDPVRLRQILVNLVGNAIKFTETGGVRVVARVEGRELPKPKFVCEVIDTGVGMTAEQMAHLFQPFQQADASTSRKFGGTGLGLAISKRLAGLLRGDITVTSQPGEGSAFVLTIDPGPLADVPFQDQPSEAVSSLPPKTSVRREQPTKSLAGRRILLAEDGIDNQRLICLLLKKAGAEVTAVENGQLAVEKAMAASSSGEERRGGLDGPFDLILMDMQMPVMDGYEATRQLRARGYSGPIIALTAHAMADDRQKCLDAGCDDYLSKPIDRATLIGKIAVMVKPKRDQTDEQDKEIQELKAL